MSILIELVNAISNLNNSCGKKKNLILSKISRDSNKNTYASSKNPTFFSKKHLFSLDLINHAENIYDHVQQKDNFLKIFSNELVRNSKIEWNKFSGLDFQPFLERNFITPISPFSLKQLKGLRIAAVDGGLGFKTYMGLNITLIKVAVVMYEFYPDLNTVIKNYPPLNEDENYSFYTDKDIFDEKTGKILASLRRSLAENSLLLKYLEVSAESPDIVILDGSLVPPPHRFSSNKKDLIDSYYFACIESYLNLYEYCIEKNITLVGSVKDSSSNANIEMIKRSIPFLINSNFNLSDIKTINYRKYLNYFSDTELFSKILKPQERTLIFKTEIKTSIYPNDIISKLNEYNFYSLYIKMSNYDIPLRIEFYNYSNSNLSVNKIEELLNILYPISKINPQCTLPVPQIEAHLRAHLRDKEMELVVRQLETYYQIKKWNNLQKHSDSLNEIDKDDTSDSNEDPLSKRFESTFFKRRHDRMEQIFQ